MYLTCQIVYAFCKVWDETTDKILKIPLSCDFVNKLLSLISPLSSKPHSGASKIKKGSQGLFRAFTVFKIHEYHQVPH